MSHKAAAPLPVEDGNVCYAVRSASISLEGASAEAVGSTELTITGRPVLVKRADTPSAQTPFALEEDAELHSRDDGELILARIDSPETLVTALEEAAKRLAQGLQIWLLYPRSTAYKIG